MAAPRATERASGRGCVYVDGVWSGPDAAVVPASDRGFLYGDGVFESLRTRDGVPVRLAAHLDRLRAGAAAVGIEAGPAPGEIATVVAEAVDRGGIADAYVRVTLTRGSTGGFDPAGAGPPRLVVSVAGLPPPPPPGGVSLALLPPGPLPEHPPPHVKATAGFMRHTLGRIRAHHAGHDDALWREPGGDVTESTSSNVFAVTSGVVHTPPTGVCLPGITRADVLDAARDAGLATSEAPLSTATLLGADEVFLTNSVAGVVAVRAVAAAAFIPGPVTRALAAAVAEVV